MIKTEYLDEYIDEEILVDDHPTNYTIQELEKSLKNENSTHENEFVQFLQAGSSQTPDEKPAQKGIKRKLSNQTSVKKRKVETPKPKKEPGVGHVIKLYAYKDCLGEYNSLIQNPDMPLWYRDGSCLIQKYLRQRCNDDELFYFSTQIYSCWEEDREKEYVELEAEIVLKKNVNFVVKIRDIDIIEDICSNGNFKELGLTPYTNYQMRATDNPEIEVANALTFKVNTSDEISDFDYEDSQDKQDENTSNDSWTDYTLHS
ncbi:unnamed protein product [Chironomus riparius]|uniref:Uncharacterized protein n=1 Tax=Chironomus riparius TaxID=315576 RepID=A0A9P0N7K6_9DIPT|nr:unnamed protein product [Chironomus riparius]